MNAKLPDGSYLIPGNQAPSQPYLYGVPNVTLIGTSVMTGDQANAALDYDLNSKDRIGVKYYYQNDPVTQALQFLSDRRLSGDPEQRIAGGGHRQHHRHRQPSELGAAPGLCAQGFV